MIELGHTTDLRPPFRYAAYTRVGFSETDAQGVVYYGRYMPYFDLARTEYHRHLDLGGSAPARATSRCAPRPSSTTPPARFDDLLEVFVRVERIGTTSVTYDHAAYKLTDGEEDELMVTAKQTLVWIDLARAEVAAGARPLPRADPRVRGARGMTAAAALDAIDRILEQGGDADDVLRDVVAALVESGACAWAGILFAEEGELVLGPEAGTQKPDQRLQLPVLFNDARVAELVVDACADNALAERVATLISAHCLVGWDTGGVPWEDVS